MQTSSGPASAARCGALVALLEGAFADRQSGMVSTVLLVENRVAAAKVPLRNAANAPQRAALGGAAAGLQGFRTSMPRVGMYLLMCSVRLEGY